ncbi:ead/Ea22-like family protein [uncultured Citrobacter sp.]|uniref:ead/Ea22-like family protein n=1 Tax=uncultured Citrobacter sp. TaxID=200446 RepID=UPI00259633D6|nr:ead/Ea22-like family protein [uncultured Citrobacter sp.]
MKALNKQALRYGDNVLWFLNELAAYDASDIDGGEFDVYGEDRNGLEGCSTIDVTELAADAAKLIEAAEKRIAELEANKCKPVMFIDGDISPADADKLAAVIREFNEETETPAARMARIIRENPHPTNMCDMPAAGIGVKGE